jgi:hypothetical protein
MTTGITLQPSGTLAGRRDLIECSAGDGEGETDRCHAQVGEQGEPPQRAGVVR